MSIRVDPRLQTVGIKFVDGDPLAAVRAAYNQAAQDFPADREPAMIEVRIIAKEQQCPTSS